MTNQSIATALGFSVLVFTSLSLAPTPAWAPDETVQPTPFEVDINREIYKEGEKILQEGREKTEQMSKDLQETDRKLKENDDKTNAALNRFNCVQRGAPWQWDAA